MNSIQVVANAAQGSNQRKDTIASFKVLRMIVISLRLFGCNIDVK